nr:MAG TPA: hypothetical protein [Caudoviricetes sp.]
MEKFQVEVKGDEKLIREAHALLLSMGCEFYIDILSTWISQKAKYLIVGSNDGDKFVEWTGFFDSQYGRTISIEKLRDLVAQSKSKEQGLISGEEAKLAWAKGEYIQLRDKKDSNRDNWIDVFPTLMISAFDADEYYEFRLKPRTVKLEIEVPACGKNYKVGQLIWILNSLDPREYCSVVLDESDDLPAYWWEKEAEIKIVVEQLKKGLKNA